jgi:ribosomal protein S18 acetylase RimI-like enzyme
MVAEEMFRDKNNPGEMIERITKDTRSFIMYIIDKNQQVLCGCNLSHGTYSETSEEYFYIYDLCTAETHHKLGLARALLHELRKFTESTGNIRFLWLTVDKEKDNGVGPDTLVEIYRRHGYEVFEDTYYDPKRYISMRRNIKKN